MERHILSANSCTLIAWHILWQALIHFFNKNIHRFLKERKKHNYSYSGGPVEES